MNELILAGSIFLASLAMTYFFCLRPMRRGNCSMGHGSCRPEPGVTGTDRGQELVRLRNQIAALRQEGAGRGTSRSRP